MLGRWLQFLHLHLLGGGQVQGLVALAQLQLFVDGLRHRTVAVHIQLQISLQVELLLHLLVVPVLLVQPLDKELL